MIVYSADFGPVATFAKMIEVAADEMEDEGFQSEIVDVASTIAMAKFATQVDIAAAASPRRLHHVYEWGEVGIPTGRLWNMVWSTGVNRTIGFNFRPSQKPVPHPEAAGHAQHIFTWKAPVMEDGRSVTIEPGEKGFLAFMEDGEWHYTKKSVTIQPGRDTQGQFTFLWNQYWSSQADSIIQQEVAVPYEAELGNAFDKLFQKIKPGNATAGVNIKPAPGTGGTVRNAIKALNRVFLSRARRRELGAQSGRISGL